MRAAIDDFLRDLHDETIVILGELHGTQELPTLLVRMAETISKSGRPVAVALELTADDQSRVDEFLKSDGGKHAVAELVSGRAWSSRDGRSSQAMLSAICDFRRLRLDGGRLRFVDARHKGFDVNHPASHRDRCMAMGVLEVADRNRDGITLFLCGNLHARRDADLPIVVEPGYEPVGSIIGAAHDRLVSLNAVTSKGAAWNVTHEGAGVHSIRGTERGPSAFIELTAPDGYDGIVYVPEFSPSPPVR